MQALAQQDKVKQLFSSPSLTAEQKSDAFIGLCGGDLDQQQSNFVRLLSENLRMPLLPNIAQLYEIYKSNHEKSVDVELESAYEVSSELSDKLSKALSKALDRSVSLHTVVNESLIGGAVIRAGDTVIDHSIRGRLEKLGEAIL